MNLTQKEKIILKELIFSEKLCVEKYSKYADQAEHRELKSLFTQIGETEKYHSELLSQMSNGIIPSIESVKRKEFTPKLFTVEFGVEISPNTSKEDKYLCCDVLTSEKHISSMYDTSIFEFTDDKARNLLNYIQKEEQEHGKKIFDYMYQNGMYAIK